MSWDWSLVWDVVVASFWVIVMLWTIAWLGLMFEKLCEINETLLKIYKEQTR